MLDFIQLERIDARPWRRGARSLGVYSAARVLAGPNIDPVNMGSDIMAAIAAFK